MLTVYAFSSDNWKRSPVEGEALMTLLGCCLANETPRCVANGVRMSIIGRRDRLPDSLRFAIEEAELQTRHCVRLALGYSAARKTLWRGSSDATSSTRSPAALNPSAKI